MFILWHFIGCIASQTYHIHGYVSKSVCFVLPMLSSSNIKVFISSISTISSPFVIHFYLDNGRRVHKINNTQLCCEPAGGCSPTTPTPWTSEQQLAFLPLYAAVHKFLFHKSYWWRQAFHWEHLWAFVAQRTHESMITMITKYAVGYNNQ